MINNFLNKWSKLSIEEQNRIKKCLKNNQYSTNPDIDQYFTKYSSSQILQQIGGEEQEPEKQTLVNSNNYETVENLKKIHLDLTTKIDLIKKQKEELLGKITVCEKKLKETELMAQTLENKNKSLVENFTTSLKDLGNILS